MPDHRRSLPATLRTRRRISRQGRYADRGAVSALGGHGWACAGEGALPGSSGATSPARQPLAARDIAELLAEFCTHPLPRKAPKRAMLTGRLARIFFLGAPGQKKKKKPIARSDRRARFADLTDGAARPRCHRRRRLPLGTVAAERANLLNGFKTIRTSAASRHSRFDLMGAVFFETRGSAALPRRPTASGMLAPRVSDAFRHLDLRRITRAFAAQPERHGTEVLRGAPRARADQRLATICERYHSSSLYLALRIADYHELAKSRPPVALHRLDDIMETFDERPRRAEAYCLCRADVAAGGQVIYLTSHQHLCNLSVATCPGARVGAICEDL